MLTLLLACFPKHPPPVAETPQLRLEAGSAPGWLALRWTLQPEWHVYWVNPGDSGMATSVQAAAPEGVTVGEALFPGPRRFLSPGDIESLGYSEELVVLLPVEGRSREPVTLEASWLVCREECHFQEATLQVPLDGSLELQAYVEALPGQVEAVPEGQGWRLPGEELFPGPEMALAASWEADAQGLLLHLEQPVPGAWGLVRSGQRYHRFDLEDPP